MISLLSCNYNTWFCRFHVDSEDELDKLPTHDTEGKTVDTKSVKSCAYGSRATCANGKTYILSGENKWVVYHGASSGLGSSGGSGDTEENIEPISDDMIYDLFK